jgi:hypothetical protein
MESNHSPPQVATFKTKLLQYAECVSGEMVPFGKKTYLFADSGVENEEIARYVVVYAW